MDFNSISTEVRFVGVVVSKLQIENTIVDVEDDAKKSIGLNINEPVFQRVDNKCYSQMIIDFTLELDQAERGKCKMELSLQGVFESTSDADEDAFKQKVAINGAAAMIGIARGKIEVLSASVFNSGKIVIPFINVLEYYNSTKQ